jgi:hypothetical protein
MGAIAQYNKVMLYQKSNITFIAKKTSNILIVKKKITSFPRNDVLS